jgi:hypothetical protein
LSNDYTILNNNYTILNNNYNILQWQGDQVGGRGQNEGYRYETNRTIKRSAAIKARELFRGE